MNLCFRLAIAVSPILGMSVQSHAAQFPSEFAIECRIDGQTSFTANCYEHVNTGPNSKFVEFRLNHVFEAWLAPTGATPPYEWVGCVVMLPPPTYPSSCVTTVSKARPKTISVNVQGWNPVYGTATYEVGVIP
jgi:hypothetical protein